MLETVPSKEPAFLLRMNMTENSFPITETTIPCMPEMSSKQWLRQKTATQKSEIFEEQLAIQGTLPQAKKTQIFANLVRVLDEELRHMSSE